jgi:cysteine desulfurase/selenocysteine lyase
MTPTASHQDYRNLFVGLETCTPLLDGSYGAYVNLDNAASTPSFKSAQRAVNKFLEYYSSVHRGTGFKSQLSTHLYEQARKIVFGFLGAKPDQHTCIFGKNTTEAINKLSRRFPFTKRRNIVLTSGMEHHSNDLPWRAATRTIHIDLTPEGKLNEDAFYATLERYADQVALVAITGGSNVTGYLNPIHRLAEKAHTHGSQILVDCAQLAPHRAIHMGSLEDPDHLDYVAISAHKMYAPFGTGALVGRRDTFERGDPDLTGGGTVEIVTLDKVAWAEPPERDEAGSPNTVGAIALAAAVLQLESIGMDSVAEHEADLTAHALRSLASVPGIRLFGDSQPQRARERLGVIPIELEGASHFLVAAILGHEFGIGVRSGCFCAHPYILHLLDLSPAEAEHVRQRMLAGDKREMPGLVRASFGLYNSHQDVEKLVEALDRIARGNYRGRYLQDPASGEFTPEGWKPDFDAHFNYQELLE